MSNVNHLVKYPFGTQNYPQFYKGPDNSAVIHSLILEIYFKSLRKQVLDISTKQLPPSYLPPPKVKWNPKNDYIKILWFNSFISVIKKFYWIFLPFPKEIFPLQDGSILYPCRAYCSYIFLKFLSSWYFYCCCAFKLRNNLFCICAKANIKITG